MTRRDLMRMAAAPLAAAPRPNRMETEIIRLRLRHTWTVATSSSDYRDNLYVRFSAQGVTGLGEGAPLARYRENAREGQRALESLREYVESADPWQFACLLSEVFPRMQGNYAAKCALDIALMDWVGKKLGIPLYRYFGLDPRSAPVTTYSIGIDTPEVTRQKVREAADFPVLKIKVGLDSDEDTIKAVRSVTHKPLRVDANEGWKSKEEAVRKILWLEKQGVELIEQPLPAHMIEESGWVRERVNIPVIADESCLHPEDVPKVAGAFDGVNVKLAKAGGILAARRMIEVARALRLKVMLGCMIESSVAVTAAAHLAPLVDWADLDGNLLIANDPYRGVRVERGKLILPEGPGLGLSPA
ncbi:MAG: dipeptide epimerase [Bryobacteraceae bacterium]